MQNQENFPCVEEQHYEQPADSFQNFSCDKQYLKPAGLIKIAKEQNDRPRSPEARLIKAKPLEDAVEQSAPAVHRPEA